MLRSQYQADRVAGLQMSIIPSSFHASPIYVPAFIFRSYHFGAKMHTFVSGDSPPSSWLCFCTQPCLCAATLDDGASAYSLAQMLFVSAGVC
jgi:hypothetical protein